MLKRVPRYAVPTQVLQLASIPLTANGKVDRQALIEVLERAAIGVPAVVREAVR